MKAPFWKRKLRQLGKKLGYQLIDANDPSDVFKEVLKYRDEPFLTGENDKEKDFLSAVIKNLSKSKAQICQDVLALYFTGYKRGGFFVEFGATDGITLSNTYLLEKDYGWSGLLAEPAIRWHDALKTNRGCLIDKRCVWSASGEMLKFHEAEVGELSSIKSYANQDGHRKDREKGRDYLVETISLNDLLAYHHAPNKIDYLSVDTEGSEYEILKNFDFSKYDIKLITVEHNYLESRQKINRLLLEKGYIQVFEGFSQWDDWYIKSS